MVNQLYLEAHRGWGVKQTPSETPSETAEKHDAGELGRALGPRVAGAAAAVLWDPTLSSHPAPRNPTPHRVSWVEGPLSPEVHHPGPALARLVEEEEEEDDNYKDEEEGPEDVLTRHVRALARARSSYVARQLRGLQARLTSDAGGPYRPGDPATELLQDVRHLLTDLQDHLAKDPDIRAVVGSRGPGIPQKNEDLGNEEDWEGTYGHYLNLQFHVCHLFALCMCSHPTSYFPSCAHVSFTTHTPFSTELTPILFTITPSHSRDPTPMSTLAGPETKEEWQSTRVGLWSEGVRESQSVAPPSPAHPSQAPQWRRPCAGRCWHR